MKNPFSSKYILWSYFTKHNVMTLSYSFKWHIIHFKKPISYVKNFNVHNLCSAVKLPQEEILSAKPLGPLYKGHKREKKQRNNDRKDEWTKERKRQRQKLEAG